MPNLCQRTKNVDKYHQNFTGLRFAPKIFLLIVRSREKIIDHFLVSAEKPAVKEPKQPFTPNPYFLTFAHLFKPGLTVSV